MGNFNNRRQSGGRSGGFGGGGRNQGGKPQMHQATCSDCGSRCEVPFRPTGDKPVYCRDCFGGNKGNDFGDKKSGPSDEQFQELNKKLDKVLKILEIMHPKKEFTVKQSEVEAVSPEKEWVEPKKEVTKKTAVKKAPSKKKPAVKKAPAKKKVTAKKKTK